MKIIAVGGGEIGRPKKEGGNYPIETRSIDEEIVNQTGKQHPKLLFIPTASGDSESYYNVVRNYFGNILGCRTDVLYLLNNRPTIKQIEDKIMSSDIVYVGGGNTLRMLKLWRKLGVDSFLVEAAKKGVVLSGVSAGAICWFKQGNSDSMKFGPSKSPKLVRVGGLDLVPFMICPHYSSEEGRASSVKDMTLRYGGVTIALEDCTAIEVINRGYRILSSSRNAHAYRIYKKDGRVMREEIKPTREFRSLEELTLK